MLEKLIWKNVFLSKQIKRNIVSFYENTAIHFQTKSLLTTKSSGNYKYNIKEKAVNYICHTIHHHWLKENKINNSLVQLPHIWQYINYKQIPMLFGLLLAKEEKVEKFKKLIEWGLNIQKVYLINGNEYNLAHQVIWAYHEKLLILEETVEILDILFEQGLTLIDQSYLISHYEKAISLQKEEKDISEQVNSVILKKQRVDTIFSWIDKSLYHYLINSVLSNHNKTLLEYIKLKQEIHQVYIERFSGNHRKPGNEMITKKLSYIEDIVKRQYIFNSQSAIYNSLVLLFNLPEFTEKMGNYVVSQCYNAFNELNNKTKRFLLSNLIVKNKEAVLINLIYQKIDMKWLVKTEDGENVLALELLSYTELIEHILTHDKFEILRSNYKGNNILHVLENLPFNEDVIKDKLKKKIKDLNLLQKNYLFYQVNENSYTPLVKAIKERNLAMVELLIELGVSGIEEVEGISKTYKSALNFITEELNIATCDNTINNIVKVSQDHEEWLYTLYKNWTIEKNFHNMNKKLNVVKKKEKVIKI